VRKYFFDIVRTKYGKSYAPARNKKPRQGLNVISPAQAPCFCGTQCGVQKNGYKKTPEAMCFEKALNKYEGVFKTY
jgi:hypothetical protein